MSGKTNYVMAQGNLVPHTRRRSAAWVKEGELPLLDNPTRDSAWLKSKGWVLSIIWVMEQVRK